MGRRLLLALLIWFITVTGVASASTNNQTYYTFQTTSYEWIDHVSPTAFYGYYWSDSWTVTLPFWFNFYGTNYSSINVNNCGVLTFPPNYYTYLYQFYFGSYYSGYEYNYSISVFSFPWYSTGMYYTTNGVQSEVFGVAPNRKFVVTWNVVQWDDYYGPLKQFQAILSEADQSIKMQYKGSESGFYQLNNGQYYYNYFGGIGLQNVYPEYIGFFKWDLFTNSSENQNKAIVFLPLHIDIGAPPVSVSTGFNTQSYRGGAKGTFGFYFQKVGPGWEGRTVYGYRVYVGTEPEADPSDYPIYFDINDPNANSTQISQHDLGLKNVPLVYYRIAALTDIGPIGLSNEYRGYFMGYDPLEKLGVQEEVSSSSSKSGGCAVVQTGGPATSSGIVSALAPLAIPLLGIGWLRRRRK